MTSDSASPSNVLVSDALASPASPTTAPPVASCSIRYQAIGCIEGTLQLTIAGKAWIKREQGDRVRLSGLRDQRVLLKLLATASQWQEKIVKWSLYPAAQPGEFVLIGLNYSESGCQLEPGQFRIQGEYQPSPVAGRFILYVGRNNVRFKGYTLVEIAGYLPDATEKQLWCCQCRLEDDRLVLEDAEKLEEAPSTDKHKPLSAAKPKPKRRSSPLPQHQGKQDSSVDAATLEVQIETSAVEAAPTEQRQQSVKTSRSGKGRK